MFKTIFDRVNVPLFNGLLNASSVRQRAIADNIANVATPGYRSKDVDFVKALELERESNHVKIQSSNPNHIPIGVDSETKLQDAIVEDGSNDFANGINNVDVDKEMVKSAENQLYYTATSRITALKFKSLHVAITGRS